MIGESRKIPVKHNLTGGFITMEKNNIFCPNCGKKDVWVRQEEEDFYVGKDHLCVSCSYVFTVQDGHADSDLRKAFSILKEMEK